MKSFRSFAASCAAVLILLAAGLAPLHAQDQTQNDGTLHALRPLIHTEQEEAELCLEFDRDLDPADHHRVTSAIKLESGGKNQPIAAYNISITGNMLCLSALEHRHEYRLVVTGLRGAKGEKLGTAYSLTFTIPDRQPSLAFAGDAYAGGLMRWQDDPVLRAINVPHAHIDLIHITDAAAMFEAWRDRRQTTLAPSESAAFAHDHGQSIWNGELDLDGEHNKAIEQKVPLQASVSNVTPGLYLIVARAPEVKPEPETESEAKSDSDSKTDAGSLAATGALWLLRSNIRLHAVRDPKGFYVLVEKADGSGVIRNAHLIVEDSGGQKIAEAGTDANGIGTLNLTPDKQAAAVILSAATDGGDMDFIDLTEAKTARFVLPGNELSIVPDKASYLPGGAATLLLTAHDAQARPAQLLGTSLQVQSPDGNSYMGFPVAPDASGVTRLSFPVPATNGVWSLVWQGQDGRALAQAPLRVTPDPKAPRIEASADRSILPTDGEVSLSLKGLTQDGKPAPYLAGRVFAAWMVPDHIFQEWKDYRFGNDAHPAGDAVPVASFVTDEKGTVVLHLNLVPPDDHASLHSAILSVRSGDGGIVADPAPLTLPMRPKDNIVGIKPFVPGGRFPENSLARFSVVAVDTDGHRQSANDLTYQIYENGRSFDWYQDEGRWNFKPLQQNRRIGGGAVKSGAGGEGVIEWPVAAGSYRLEITDANGTVRAATEFSAGWSLPEFGSPPAPLGLTPSASILRPGQETRIRFTLDHPLMISVFIGDDHIRRIIHQLMPKGENSIAFSPDRDWGSRIGLRIEADNMSVAGQITLPLLHEGQSATSAAKETPAPDILVVDIHMPPSLRTGDVAHLTLDMKNNAKTPALYHTSVVASPDSKIAGLAPGSLSLAAGQWKTMPFTLAALRPGTASLKLDVAGPARFHLNRDVSVPILPDMAALGLSSPQRIEPQQSWPAPAVQKARPKNETGILFLSPAPLYNAPAFLADIVRAHVFTTAEIAGMMETLRLWHDPVLAAGLAPGAALEAQRQGLLFRLLARQNADGGFPPAPEDPADFSSTAEALAALAHAEQPVAKPAADLAAGWLKHRLENTWFDENERPLRAAAYAALAEADRLDAASLHYFGDTSADKALPPLAAAQLALAFARSNDQDKASFWLDVSGVRKDSGAISPALLPLLAANPFFDPQALEPVIEKLNTDLAKNPARTIESLTGLLRTVWFVQHRKGAWRVTVNTDKRNPKDVLAFVMPEKTASFAIHNSGDGPLFAALVQQKVPPAVPGSITRHIYQLNGNEAGGHVLEQGKTYLVVLEGSWTGEGPLLVHDNPAAALRPAGCLPPAPLRAGDELGWLKGQTLTPLAKCEIWGEGVDMLTAAKASSTSWRVAYIATAEWAGSFDVMFASARNSGESQDIMHGEKTRMDVR